MAEEIINLATFQFDVDKLNQNVDKLTDSIFDLTKKQQAYANSSKEAQQQINSELKLQASLIAAGQSKSAEYTKSIAIVEKLTASQKENYKAQVETGNQLSRVKTELSATNKELQAYMNSEAKQNNLSTQADTALSKQIQNINQARASNTELLRVRNQLNPSIEIEARLIDDLNKKLDSNNEFIKQNASAYEKQKINVGNYSESIKDAFGNLNIFNGGIGGFISRSEEAGGAGNLLKNSLSGAATGFLGLAKAGLAFIATPIGAAIALLVGAFLLIKNAMDKNIKSADKITSIFKALGSIFNTVLKLLEPLGTFIIDVLVDAFEMLGEVAEKAIAFVGDALDALGFDDAAKSVRDFAAETKESTKQAYELAKAERELDQAMKRAKLTQLEYQKNAEKLRQLRDDESKSFSSRVAANKDLGKLLDEQAKKELAIANQALKVAEMKAKSDKLDKTIQDDYIEALTQIADIEERIEGQRSEQLANENSLRKEAAAAETERQNKAIELSKKKADAAIKAMQTELDFYLESQGERKKSMAEQLEVDRETMRQSLAINKAEYDAKKLTRREYELANLEVTNEFAAKQVEATIANADIEFELFKLNNQRKLDENKFFSEELYQQELERLNKLAEAEAAQQTLLFEKGKINAQEYGLAIAQIDADQQAANDAAAAEREQAKKDKEAADIVIQDELNAERFDYDIALQMERYDRQYALEKEAAIKAGADMVAFEQAQALKKQAIEQAVQNNKLELASQTLGNLATLLGKESAAGKAAAIAQTTIDTYKAAQSAYSALAGIPIVGPVLGALAAGAAVVTGLANVKKITSVKEPKTPTPNYARGVIGLKGAGTMTSDSIPANLSLNESVMTGQTTSMFPNLLGALNQAGGGVGYSGSTGLTPSENSLLQNDISNNANSSAMVEAMASAVYLAAKEGTQKGSTEGITNLSDNRQIMADAKF